MTAEPPIISRGDPQTGPRPARETRRFGAGIFPKLLLSALSLVIMLGALEGAAYIWERGQANGPYAWELVASRRIEIVAHPDPPPGYTLLAAGSRWEWGGIPVEINGNGLRGPETPYAKPPGTIRILNLGDSIAMGWGVAYEDSYGYLLQGLLTGEIPSAGRIEVINAGVPGWNVENELAFLRSEGLRYEPDLIVLELTLPNDITGSNALKKGDRSSVIEWLRAHTYFFPFLSIQASWIEARADGRERIPVLDPPTTPGSYFPVDAGDDKWDAFWGPVAAIAEAARAEGIPVVLVLFPLEFQVVDPDFPTTPQEVLVKRAGESGLPIVDLLSVFQAACAEKPGGPCVLEDRYLFADVWMHPSPLGNRIAAETILPVLVETID